jgi:hypothetical protein
MGKWMYRSEYSFPQQKFEASVQLYVPVAPSPEKRPRYPLYRRLGGPQNRFGRIGEEKNLADKK